MATGARLAGRGGVVYGLGALFGLTSRDTIIPPTNLNTSFFIAIGAAIFMQYFMWRTKWGYELRAVGVAPKAAEYGGASVERNTVLALTLSGAFAGLTACNYVLGGGARGILPAPSPAHQRRLRRHRGGAARRQHAARRGAISLSVRRL